MTVVVVTADFEVYHALVNSLRDRDVDFMTIGVSECVPRKTSVVITGVDEHLEDVPVGVSVIRASASKPREAVEQALAAQRESGGRRDYRDHGLLTN